MATKITTAPEAQWRQQTKPTGRYIALAFTFPTDAIVKQER
jgi:hypothetical protein